MSINGGIGDNIIVRVFFDTIRGEYEEIRVSHNRKVIDHFKNGDPSYYNFLNELGTTLFSKPPYVFDHVQHDPLNVYKSIKSLAILPHVPDLSGVLCVGASLNLGEEYIVITTKIRGLSKAAFYPLSISLWQTLRKLSEKYKIVILGEREVEKNKEYVNISNLVFSIYEQIITNLPTNRIVDLTVPSLGITTPNLEKIKQDCLIMKEARCVVTLAAGGNVWLAAAVGNVIGFRVDNGNENNYVNDMISCTHNPYFHTGFIVQDWWQFISRLGSV